MLEYDVAIFFHGCAIDMQILFAVKHKRLCFNMKSSNIGMSLIKVWTIVIIVNACRVLDYKFHVCSATMA